MRRLGNWTVQVYDLRSGAYIGEARVTSFGFQPALGSAGTMSTSIAVSDTMASRIAEGAAMVHLLDEQDIIASFIVWSHRWQNYILTLDGKTARSWLEHRTIRADKTYAAVDQFTIASDLLAYANSSSLGIMGGLISFRGTPGATSGVVRTKAWAATERKGIASALDDLAVLDGGYEWDITAQWTGPNAIGMHLDAWYPTRGSVTTLVWEHGKNCNVNDYSSDASGLATLVDVASSDSGGATVFGTASEAPATYARFDLLDGTKDTAKGTETAVLSAAATASLARNHLPIETIVVDTLAVDDATHLHDTDVSRWGLGDEVTFIADLGYRQVAGTYRVSDAQYVMQNKVLTATQATLVRPVPGAPIRHPDWFADVGPAMQKRVSALERR